MAKPEWGAKHTCQSCAAKFYDMGRSPVTCPACDEPVAVAPTGRTRRVRKEEVKAAPAVEVKDDSPKDGEEALADEVEDLADDDDDDDEDAIATLADGDDEDDDDVLAEADIDKSKIADE